MSLFDKRPRYLLTLKNDIYHGSRVLVVGICTDWASCMIGSIKGFVSFMLRENPNVVQAQCFFHREVLVSKITPDE